MEKFFDWLLSGRSVATFAAAAFGIIFVIWSRKNYARHFKKKDDYTGVDFEGTVFNEKQDMTANILHTILRILIVIVMVLLILKINGVAIGTLLAGLGIAGAIAGLAVQDILKDMLMGIRILRDEFFVVGDGIRYDGMEGIVVSFNLQTTKIENIDDHSLYVICNRNLDKIVKLSYLVDVDFPLGYDVPLKVSSEMIKKVCGQVWLMNEIEGCYYKGVEQLGDSAIIHRIRFFTKPENKHDMIRAVNKLILEKVAEAGLEIPFNQLDVNFKYASKEDHKIAFRMQSEQQLDPSKVNEMVSQIGNGNVEAVLQEADELDKRAKVEKMLDSMD